MMKSPHAISSTSFARFGTTRRLAMGHSRKYRTTTSTHSSIATLAPGDLERTVTIRGEPFHVVEALNRLATHAAYHVGQIVLLAKHFAGPNWKSLSIPKGQSKHAKGTYKQGIVPRRPI